MSKPVEWVSALLTRFEEHLPCRIGPQTHHTRTNVQQNKESLINISRHKFSLVISGLTKTLTKINDLKPALSGDLERDYHESLLIVLDTLEKCLSLQAAKHRNQTKIGCLTGSSGGPHGLYLKRQAQTVSTPGETSRSLLNGSEGASQPQTATAPQQKYDEIMNVKLLLKEICQFLDMQPNSGPTLANDNLLPSMSSYNMVSQIRKLASKILFALSVNNFGAVFNRIQGRLQELSVSNEENPDNHTDIELIQHIDVDVARLTRLLHEAIGKFRQLKKNAQLTLMGSMEKAIWNWMDNYRKFLRSKVIQ